MITPEQLPHDYPRRYLDAAFDGAQWAHVKARYDELEARSLPDAGALKRWLDDWMELDGAVDEAGSLRYVAMTCATDNPGHEKAYLDFLEGVAEPSKPRDFALVKKYLAAPARGAFAKGPGALFDRSARSRADLYRPENVALETEVDKLSQKFQKLSGALTVEYEGQERTLQQMGRTLEESDRDRRQDAWHRISERRLRDKERFEDLFDQMLEIRGRISAQAGFGNFRDYMFKRKERFDYGPADCESFHLAVEKHVVPLVREIQDRRRKRLGLDKLKPWDLSCDPEGRGPLRPFAHAEDLVSGVHRILGAVDPEFGKLFGRMKDLGLLDLDSRKGKAPGGYQSTLSEARLPFIFMNSVGQDGDVRTLLHEGGHALHAFLARDRAFAPERHAPMEFCEVASMSMELLGDPHLGAFYGDPADAARSIVSHLENVVVLLPWIATVDAFQHWIYLNPKHTRGERKAHWTALRRRFGGIEDWTGLEDALAYGWHRQLHIFELPFYYIEYGIAQLGALQVWRNARKNLKTGVAGYKNGLAVGGSKTLPEIFTSAGIKFDFSADTIRPLVAEVKSELARLDPDKP